MSEAEPIVYDAYHTRFPSNVSTASSTSDSSSNASRTFFSRAMSLHVTDTLTISVSDLQPVPSSFFHCRWHCRPEFSQLCSSRCPTTVSPYRPPPTLQRVLSPRVGCFTNFLFLFLVLRLCSICSSRFCFSTGCSQIPKLKVACAPGLGGKRTMWSFCEQCGAISMVDDGTSS
jgi:hypothetical protein